MKYYILGILFLFGAAGNAFAQNSDDILNELSEKAKGFKNIHAKYSSRLIDKANGIDLKQTGEAYVEGEKYYVELGDYIMITDGETIWTYEKETNDCYVDYLEDVGDDASMSPSKMFTIWEEDFKHEFKEMSKVNGRDCYLVYLYPNNPAENAFHTIQLYVDKAKMEVVKFIVKGREGNDVIYEVTDFNPNTTLPSGVFQFQESKHPGVNIIDNRL
ncbi:MAG: outer membrane lipoprotein carrier protein LolA [Flavobacteriales bacterium]|nr:outer membrane lipoprotein carrier protein LolA [Flavobacteriales bacterium]